MHELSIAHSLVELASEAATKAGASQVEAVYLRLGALSGVVKDALLFGFEVATSGTPLAGARLEIEDVPVQLYCWSCETRVEPADARALRCPRCGTPTAEIVQGRELEITALEVADTPALRPREAEPQPAGP